MLSSENTTGDAQKPLKKHIFVPAGFSHPSLKLISLLRETPMNKKAGTYRCEKRT